MLKFATLRDINVLCHGRLLVSPDSSLTLQSDMKKINNSTSTSSDAKASSASKADGSDSNVEVGIVPAAEAEATMPTEPAEDTIRPRVKKSKSKLKTGLKTELKTDDFAKTDGFAKTDSAAKADSAVTTGKKKPSSRAVDHSADEDDFGLADSAEKLTASSAPSYRVMGQSGDRIAIFIDGSNLFYAASHLNIEVDYRRLLTTLVGDRRLLRAYFYTGVDPLNEKQRGFLLWLNRHGHRVISKELTTMPDGSRKANMHVEMAVDMMRISDHCSTITLLGGDGNLTYALDALSRKGISIEVVSLQSMTSDSLIDIADSYVDLADLRDDIKR